MKTFIIAEAGVNHNGSLDMAMELVERAAASRVDAIKFQTFHAEQLVTASGDKAEYQKAQTGDGDQLSMLRALELPLEWHHQLIERCQQLGVEFMSTAFDETSLNFLVELGVKRLKCPSGELTNLAYIEQLASKKLPIILSTGMGDLEEVREAVSVVKASWKALGLTQPVSDMLTLLHCTSNYPAPLEEVNLRAIKTLADTFQLPVGYSDHTQGILISTTAVAMGAQVIEKHFTLDRNLPGPDHAASLEPDELTQMVSDIRSIEQSMGDGVKAPMPSERLVRNVARRSVTTRTEIQKGTLLIEEHLVLMRPGDGIPPKEMPRVVGKVARHDLANGQTLQWSDLEP